ncbi:MAG: sigma-70 family RNA polymerase sigma factor [Bryobacterales bacterium]|nr:sigma-70 family RNA polymerase sigma factor [Bryobacterales bacterium]
MSPTGRPPEAVSTSDITQLLARWRAGDSEAFAQASEAVYPELHRIAAAYLQRERPGHTLQPTALIHEAFLRLSSAGRLEFASRGHFFALAASLMRRILVDHARSINAAKRGGRMEKVSLDNVPGYHSDAAEAVLRVHEALDRLKDLSATKAQIVELRYFGGLTLEETAEVIGVSVASAHRAQRFAEAWLTEQLSM